MRPFQRHLWSRAPRLDCASAIKNVRWSLIIQLMHVSPCCHRSIEALTELMGASMSGGARDINISWVLLLMMSYAVSCSTD